MKLFTRKKDKHVHIELLVHGSPLGKKVLREVIKEFGHNRGSWTEFDLDCFIHYPNSAIGRMDIPNTLAANKVLKRITSDQIRVPTLEEVVKFGVLLPRAWSYTSTMCVFPTPSTVRIYEHFNERLRQQVLELIGIKETKVPLLVDGLEVKPDPSAVYVSREELIRRNKEEGPYAPNHPNYRFRFVVGKDFRVIEAPFLAEKNKQIGVDYGREYIVPLSISHDGKEYKFGTKDDEPLFMPLKFDHLQAFRGLVAFTYDQQQNIFDEKRGKMPAPELSMDQGFLGATGPDLTIISGMSEIGITEYFGEIYEKEIASLPEHVKATLAHYAEIDPKKLMGLVGRND